MLQKRIIPCLDVTKGRVVKGTKFLDLKDAGDPVELAKRYNEEGADELVFLDITASSDNRYILVDVVEKTASQVFIPFTVGGGISDIPTIRDMLNAGADKVSINSAAINDPEIIASSSQRFGSQCIVTAIDARRIDVNTSDEQEVILSPYPEVALDHLSKWEVYSHGGRHRTGIDAVKWAVYLDKMGSGEILLTSMDQDGTKEGYDVSLTSSISELVSIPVIASGGAGAVDHITEVLEVCEAALLASLLHFRELSIDEIKSSCHQKSIPIRMC